MNIYTLFLLVLATIYSSLDQEYLHFVCTVELFFISRVFVGHYLREDDSSGVTDGEAVVLVSPWQAKYEKWPLLACISVFSILLIFNRFLFLAVFKDFSECFPVISGVGTDRSRIQLIA